MGVRSFVAINIHGDTRKAFSSHGLSSVSIYSALASVSRLLCTIGSGKSPPITCGHHLLYKIL